MLAEENRVGGWFIIGGNILLIYFMFQSIKVILKKYKISRGKMGSPWFNEIIFASI
jgi:hypothetical protein